MTQTTKQVSFRAIYEAPVAPPKGATGRQARTFPVMARALRDLPESRLPAEAGRAWVWSDLHLGHENIIRFCNRPFRDAGHMDNALQHQQLIRLDRLGTGQVDWSAKGTTPSWCAATSP